MNRDDFENYADLDRYWLQEDGLRSLDFDLYFSLGTKYHCAAGCNVCYIKDNLIKTKDAVDTIFPSVFLDKIWHTVFDYFGSIRTNDDLFYMKHHLPEQYQWYKDHGSLFELCITDNAIFRTLDLDIELKTLGDVSVSTDFLKKVGVEKVVSALSQLYEKFGIQKIKYIDCGDPELLHEVIKFTEKYHLHNCVHHDFRTDTRVILDANYAEYQNTWVFNDSKGLMQVYRESLHLYHNGFYFSSDDASDMMLDPFYVIQETFDPASLIVNMLRGKQKQYAIWKNRIESRKFKDYYATTLGYRVNDNFTFIPVIMYPSTSRFFYKLEEDGWIRTAYGMLKGSSVIPLIEKNKQ